MKIYDRLIFRVQAIKRMFERAIGEDDVKHVIFHGVVIQEYPEDQPYPSVVLLGWRNNRPLHVVAASSDTEKLQLLSLLMNPILVNGTVNLKIGGKNEVCHL